MLESVNGYGSRYLLREVYYEGSQQTSLPKKIYKN